MAALRELGGEGTSLKGEGRIRMWKVLQKNYPKQLIAVPVGKKDMSGKIVTDHEDLKHLYLRTYESRLRNRPIKENLNDIKDMKGYFC